jgi:YHS domain-containing protein
MLRFFILRFVLPLVLFLIVRYIVKSIWGSMNSPVASRGDAASRTPAGGELKKDPVCGIYVAPATSVTKTVKGQQMFFCSTACRDKYTA